jgi:short-subunit dehydrogenase
MAYSLITGASGGIGWAIAKELAARKHNILLIASQKINFDKCRRLRNTFAVNVDYLPIDLSTSNVALTVKDWLIQKIMLLIS